MQRIIEQTEDGSATLYVPELNEHYHSVKGARTESQHIFIDMGLKASAAPCPHILEAGFGTGLNALLTLQEAERTGRPVRYTGIELYPLAWTEVEALHYSDDPRLRLLHEAPWEEEVCLTPTPAETAPRPDLVAGRRRTPAPALRRGLLRRLRTRKTARPLDTRRLPQPLPLPHARRHPDHLLRQGRRAPPDAGHRLPHGAPPRTSGRKAGDTARHEAERCSRKYA